ncbi:MAG: hypothetical protein LC099_06790 [Anaerolineales bacterium]|nr:hypothetical protein [Anaerolineales bacterium]MCZ2127465.1 hypothetical protein [Anaerolineales bacterium]
MFNSITPYLLVALLITAGTSLAVIQIKNNRIDALIKEQAAFIAAIDIATKDAEIKVQQKEKQYAEAKESADAKYQDTIARLKLDANSLRIERDKARSTALSNIARRSKDPDRLCFNRTKLERAIEQFEQGVSGIAGQSDDRDAKLIFIRDWYNTLKNMK